MRWLLICVVCVLAAPAWAGPPAPAPKEDTRPKVAVFYFETLPDTDQDLSVFRKALSQILIADLVETDRFQVVDRDRIEAVMKEQDFQYSGRVDPATRVKLGKLVGAHWRIFGNVFKAKKGFRITAYVESGELGTFPAMAKVLVTDDDVLSGEDELVQKLVAGLVKATKVAPIEGETRKQHTRLPYKTAVRYAKALDARDKKDTETAKKELNQVLKEQPEFALAKVDLLALMK